MTHAQYLNGLEQVYKEYRTRKIDEGATKGHIRKLDAIFKLKFYRTTASFMDNISMKRKGTYQMAFKKPSNLNQ